jgi:hypothetical protein
MNHAYPGDSNHMIPPETIMCTLETFLGSVTVGLPRYVHSTFHSQVPVISNHLPRCGHHPKFLYCSLAFYVALNTYHIQLYILSRHLCGGLSGFISLCSSMSLCFLVFFPFLSLIPGSSPPLPWLLLLWC